MKRKIPIGSLVFIASSVVLSLCASEPRFISYEDWEEISTQFQGNKHQIVLKSGSKLVGTLVKLPALNYTFTSFDFDPQEILVIAAVQTPEGLKLQYVTHSGQNYVATPSVDRFVYIASESDLSGNSKEIKKEIDPILVDYILLNHPSIPFAGYNGRLSSLEFQNSDQLPVILLNDAIAITDGWAEKSLKSSDLIQISFQGGLCAKVYKEERIVDIDFSYIKEPFLSVQVERDKHHMKFPWSQIAYLQTTNGGFFRENPTKDSGLRINQRSNKASGSEAQKIGLGWVRRHEVPDQIGLARGEDLDRAFGASALCSDAVASAVHLGHEPIVALDPLFAEQEVDFKGEDLLVVEYQPGEDLPVEVFAETETAGNETLVALQSQFHDTDVEVEQEPFIMSDWISPLFNEQLPEDVAWLYSFSDDDMDESAVAYLYKGSQAAGENFDLDEEFALKDSEEDTEIDYLEAIAQEVDMSSIMLETYNYHQAPEENTLIGIDEIISQEDDFYDSEEVDPTLFTDLLWNLDDEEALYPSKTKEALMDQLWNYSS